MIVFSTGFETGDLDGFSWWKIPPAEVLVTDEAACSGLYSVKLQVSGIDIAKRAAEINRYDDNLIEGYYSARLMFPVLPTIETVISNGWLTIFQFIKHNENTDEYAPTWYNTIRNENGQSFLALNHHGIEYEIEPNVNELSPLEAGKWFHIEWYYKDGVDDGIIRVWLNDLLIWDLENVNTRGIDPAINWAINVYGVYVIPGDLIMYVDDCTISTERMKIEMSIITDLQAIETELRQHVLDLTAQADAIAQVIVDLQALDDTLDTAADVINAD